MEKPDHAGAGVGQHVIGRLCRSKSRPLSIDHQEGSVHERRYPRRIGRFQHGGPVEQGPVSALGETSKQVVHADGINPEDDRIRRLTAGNERNAASGVATMMSSRPIDESLRNSDRPIWLSLPGHVPSIEVSLRTSVDTIMTVDPSSASERARFETTIVLPSLEHVDITRSDRPREPQGRIPLIRALAARNASGSGSPWRCSRTLPTEGKPILAITCAGQLVRLSAHSTSIAIKTPVKSPGTKVYSTREIKELLSYTGFEKISARSKLGPGDLLTIKPSSRYQSLAARVIWKIYPRWLTRLLGDRFGLGLLVEARKPSDTSANAMQWSGPGKSFGSHQPR